MGIINFENFRLCRDGQLLSDQLLSVSSHTGRVFKSVDNNTGKTIDLNGAIVAPGLLELQTNGAFGFHFTTFENIQQYNHNIEAVASRLVERGVTGFWATIPTVEQELYKKILPNLEPREFRASASLLGAHVEGPYLNPDKAGAHAPTLFKSGNDISPASLFGTSNLANAVQLITLAPEVPGADELITYLTSEVNVRVSLGHSSSDFDLGVRALRHGATALTHVFNAMSSLHHREPGLAGLIASEHQPFYSLIADNVHLHPATLSMAFRANPKRAILISDSLELSGLPDGVFPGNAQVKGSQEKKGDRVVLAGTETLVGGCAGLDQCVRNLVQASGCGIAEAVKCVTENVAMMMGEKERGLLEEGCRADLVVLDDDANVLQTWIAGRKVWG